MLQTQQVLTGILAVESEYDIVLHKQGDRVDIYPAHRVKFIQFFDSKANINRKYISVQQGTWKQHHLYEVVVRGPIQVVRKQKLDTSSAMPDADNFVYYIYSGIELIHIQAFRKQVYPALKRDGGIQFSMFVLEQNLNPNEAAHAILMVRYYNALMLNDETFARSAEQ